jgi:hypothetical protein
MISGPDAQQGFHSGRPRSIELTGDVGNKEDFTDSECGSDFTVTIWFVLGTGRGIEISVQKLCQVTIRCALEQKLLSEYAA